MNESTKQAVKAVRAHAITNYGKDGWDIVVECYSDGDIIAVIEREGSADAAIVAIGEEIATIVEYRDDVRGYGGCFDSLSTC